MRIGLLDFVVFALYYLILKALVQFINIESRRKGLSVLAGVSGLYA